MEMVPERFGVVFQVAKELPNVSDQVVESQGCTRGDADELLGIFRLVRAAIREGATRVRFRPVSRSGEERVLADRAVVEVVAARDDRVKWCRMLEAVCASLGPEELYLRSGYREAEVREAIGSLVQ